ncbi:hypothetical protein [Alteribacter populi]|uniref:hypothetical protein n=1 Tax=Alteribacter populi TaxID=2011011 RepID=UPI000BBB116D|nr:hypothetical protein [Alteribacter populi]
MEIADIQAWGKKHYNKGVGSFLLHAAEQYAEPLVVSKINGVIESDSDEHFRRQVTFYRKNQFLVIEKTIEKQLSLGHELSEVRGDIK